MAVPDNQKSFLHALQSKSPPLHSSLPDNPELQPKTQFLGEPACLYTDEEISTLSSHYANALVGKFTRGRLTMEQLESAFKTAGFVGKYQLGALDFKHVLLRFDLPEDYQRCWIKGFWSFNGTLMKVLKWSPDFSIHRESSIVPIWCTIREVPLYYYNASSIESIGNSIGTFIKKDSATEMLTRPSAIKICVEIDLLKPLCPFIRLGSTTANWKYNIEYEDVPLYCRHCSKLGHSSENCRTTAIAKSDPKPQWNATGRKFDKVPSGINHQDISCPDVRPKTHHTATTNLDSDPLAYAPLSPYEIPAITEHTNAPITRNGLLHDSDKTYLGISELIKDMGDFELGRSVEIYAKDDIGISSRTVSSPQTSPLNPHFSSAGKIGNSFAVLQDLDDDANLFEDNPIGGHLDGGMTVIEPDGGLSDGGMEHDVGITDGGKDPDTITVISTASEDKSQGSGTPKTKKSYLSTINKMLLRSSTKSHHTVD